MGSMVRSFPNISAPSGGRAKFMFDAISYFCGLVWDLSDALQRTEIEWPLLQCTRCRFTDLCASHTG